MGHYDRQRRGIDLNTPIRKLSSTGICKLDYCNRKHKAKVYCGLHRYRQLNNLPMDAPVKTVDMVLKNVS